MNRTIITKKIPLPDKGKVKNHGQFIKTAVSFLIGFSLSQLHALGSLSPFSTAFVSGISFEYCFSAFLGAAIGYFVSSSVQVALRYLISLFIVTVFRLTVLKRFGTADKPFVCSVVSLCGIACCGAVYVALTGFTYIKLLLVIAESLLAMGSTFFFMYTVKIPVLNIGIKQLSSTDKLCTVLCLCIFIMCLSGLTVGSISPARIICALIVIFAASYKGIGVSSIAGICAGLSLCIDPQYRYIFPLFALGGLVCGIFSSLGNYSVSLAFALTACGVTLFSGFDGMKIAPLAEAMITAAAYAAIPSARLCALEQYIEKSGLVKDEEIDRQVCANLMNAAEKVEDVSEIVSKVSERLDRVINPEINRIFAKMQQNVCYGCTKKSECWNKLFSGTAADIMEIAGITVSASPKTQLEKRCIRPKALLREIERYYIDFVEGMAAKIKMTEMRSIVSEQFSCVASFLGDVALQAENSRIVDSARSRSVRSALQSGGISLDALRFFTGPNGRVTVETDVFESTHEIDYKKVKTLLELSTGKKFERPDITLTDLKTTALFNEKAAFYVQIGHCQIPLAKNKVCGDCIGHTKDVNGNEIVLISDGMGTGSRAAIDATMTSTLMEKLLSCGFSFETALRMVNCALMIKSTDESLSTIDAISINIYTGDIDFYKAGAAISFVRRNNDVTVIEEPSMPIGIIRNTTAAHRVGQLIYGDIVLLVSDGVTGSDCGWINDELLAWSTNSMKDLASHIASLAKLRSDDNNADDITVIAAKLMKNQ